MKVLFVASIAICSLVMLPGCGLNKEKQAGEKAAQAYFQARMTSGGLGSDEFYSEEFLANSTSEQWVDYKNSISTALGKLKAYALINSAVSKKWNEKVGDQRLSGTFVMLLYGTEYERGKGQEALVLFKRSGTDKFLILSLQVDSDRFKELMNKAIQQENLKKP